MQPPEPVLVADRFPALLASLLDLLAGLSDDEWHRPVHAGAWSVKELAQHLLGDEINILSGKRDRFHEQLGPIDSWESLVALINRRNAEWVQATRRMSPRVIIDLLASTGAQANAHFAQLDPYAIGGPVNWAGPDPAPVWLDIAREFTERWHHQQHIRQAVGKPGALKSYYLAPVLATFARALPRTYHNVAAAPGAVVCLRITGEGGSEWAVAREGHGWTLYAGCPDHPAAEVTLPSDVAWQLFTRGITPDQAQATARLSGDPALALRLLDTVAIIA